MSKASLSLVIPCYNESGNIPLIFNKLEELLTQLPEIEILLVNNGSKDNSKDVFEQELSKTPFKQIRVVDVAVNQGYGFGILSGLKEATAPVLSWTHADMQTDPMDVLAAFRKYEKANNKMLLVKGTRLKRNFADAFFTWGMQVLASVLLAVPLHDINAQPKLFSREFYDKFMKQNAPLDFSLDLYALYCAKKYGAIETVPVYFNKRIHGEAKGGGSFKTKIKLMKRTWAYMLQLSKELKQK
ncbi:Glycosyltransferase involved in cell wall bisynthesis [Flexibacter flexilis DSM 6793]|uniref:Glycosyltransferase involved in cell wall bisynthesis n=1 Tax=Flexibacter flexilis DSM 6793 TaxID=927664 RepID=A0A1I1H0B2_9BACT|nr:glycosyltransferase family 2 protein [Flexibacter flexilis]SFC17205.1 Glycosyltransferase involved in cell wall bisynthesis [Flexibacter flexilis DSM 6793]